MEAPPLILLYGRDAMLVETRKWVIQTSGFDVVTATTIEEVEQVVRLQRINLFVLCDSLQPSERCGAVELLERSWPSAKLLILVTPKYPVKAEWGDKVFQALDGPARLISVLHEMLPCPARGTEDAAVLN